MQIQDGDTVELFGESQTLSEALVQLGVTPEEYAQYKKYEPKDSVIADIMKDLKVEEVDSAEIESKATLYAFNTLLEQNIDAAIQKKEKFLDKMDQPLVPSVNMLAEFQEEYGVDVDQMIDRATLDKFGKIENNHLPYIQLYKDWLYKGDPDGEFEDNKIKSDIYEDMVMHHADELVSSVGQRREKTLGFAIQTFNKIQGRKVPKFYDESLNLEPKTEGDKTIMKVKDTKLINETIERFNYLLHDKQSPIISNFLSLADSQGIPS